MLSAPRTALYSIIDSLGVPVVLDAKDKKVFGKGATTLKVKVGPMAMKFPVRVHTDHLGENAASVLIHFRGHLWGLAYSSIPPQGIKDKSKLWIALFNGDSLDFPAFITGNVVNTLEKISKKVVACYKFTGEEWKPVDLESLKP